MTLGELMFRRVSLVPVAVALTLVTASFASVPAGAASTTRERAVKVDALFVRRAGGTSTGGTNPVTVRISTSNSKEFRVGFTEDEVAGTGDSWRAAGWNAATVATLLNGSPLGGTEITFDVSGEIDGPSAGALMTIGILSLL